MLYVEFHHKKHRGEKCEISERINKIEQLLKQDKQHNIVAVGEIGLDYYWVKDNKEIQKELFIKQIELANTYKLPIVIHTREAVMDTIQIIKENKPQKQGIIHCCAFNRELVKEDKTRILYLICRSSNF